MDKMKKVAQGGWHPDKDRASKPSYQQKEPSSSTDSKLKNFKGLQQVAGWAGYKGSSATESEGGVQTRPLTSLQDPSAFGALPKRDPKAPLPPPKPKPSTAVASQDGHGVSAPVKPGLPPRATPALPPRVTSGSPTVDQPPRQNSFPNVSSHGLTGSTQSASSRLAAAGVSVPGFNIGSGGGGGKPAPPETNSSSKRQTMNPSAVRESYNKTQTALKPLSNYQHGKPVSLGEMRSAATAASSLREKHGDQVAEGYRRAEKAGLVDRAANATSPRSTGVLGALGGAGAGASLQKWIPGGSNRGSTTATEAPGLAEPNDVKHPAAVAAKKKPPPPPLPNRKPQPPPIPFGSKPK